MLLNLGSILYFIFIVVALLVVYLERKLTAFRVSIGVIICLWLDSLLTSRIGPSVGSGAGSNVGSGSGSGAGSGAGSTERPTVAWLSPISRLSLGCSRYRASITLLFSCTGLGGNNSITIIIIIIIIIIQI